MDAAQVRQALLFMVGPDFPSAGNTALWYGSRLASRDIDILVVQSCSPPVPTAILGRLDLLMLRAEYFEAMLSLFDPLVVEPVLTGELLFGDEKIFNEWQSRVRGKHPGNASVKHLAARSVTELTATLQTLDGYAGEGEHVKWAFQNLSFSIAYASFAKRYAKADSRCCTLTALLADGDAYLPPFWRFRDEIKAGAPLTRNAVERWFDEWSRCMILQMV